jgi:hypothetical protein
MKHIDHVIHEHRYNKYEVTYSDLLKIKEEMDELQGATERYNLVELLQYFIDETPLSSIELDFLEDNALICCYPDPSGYRAYTLTPKGRDIVKRTY